MNTNIDTNAQEINRKNENPVNETAPHLIDGIVAVYDPHRGDINYLSIREFDEVDPIKNMRLLIQQNWLKDHRTKFDGFPLLEWTYGIQGGVA